MIKARVLFICLGNICRSPGAEAILQSILKREGKEHLVEVDSCGTSGWHSGSLCDPRLRKVLEKRGIESTSRSRKLTVDDFKNFDYLIVMDDSNFKNVLSLDKSGEYAIKVYKMIEFASGDYKGVSHVKDPYFGTEVGFEKMLNLLTNTCENFYKDELLERLVR